MEKIYRVQITGNEVTLFWLEEYPIKKMGIKNFYIDDNGSNAIVTCPSSGCMICNPDRQWREIATGNHMIKNYNYIYLSIKDEDIDWMLKQWEKDKKQ